MKHVTFSRDFHFSYSGAFIATQCHWEAEEQKQSNCSIKWSTFERRTAILYLCRFSYCISLTLGDHLCKFRILRRFLLFSYLFFAASSEKEWGPEHPSL